MYKTIILDCEAGEVSFSCENCIAFNKCTIDKKNKKRSAEKAKTNDLHFYVCHI